MGDEWLSEPDIKERVGGNQTLTAKAIRALYDAGELQRTGAGKRGDPYLYAKASPGRENARPESPILDSLDMINPENRENRESDEPAWLMEGVGNQGVPWMVGEPDEVRERAAIMEIDGGLPAVEAARLARLWATAMAA